MRARLRSLRPILIALLFSVIAVPAARSARQSEVPAKQKPAGKTKKASEPPAAPVSDILQRIQTEQARLELAQNLAQTATTPDEIRLARKAARLADHELELAFLIGLRRAADNPTPPQAQAQKARVDALAAEAAQQQAVVDGLKQQAAKARGRQQETLQAQVEFEQAKLELANDELADAREDLIAAGGDLKTQIERLQAEHEAAEQHAAASAAPAAGGTGSPAPAQSSDTLLASLRVWFGLRGARSQLDAAREDALAAAESTKERQSEFASQAGAAPPASAAAPAGPASAPAAPSILETIRQKSRTERILAGYKLRIRDLEELAATYQKWGDLVGERQNTAGRAVLRGLLWIALFVLVGFITNRLAQRFIARLTEERRRLHTLRTLSRFAIQVVTLGLILLVVLGPPSQLATLVAFAGAGLTVALKDFIVSFIGWFMLMGRNGVHVGDWVEINGVCGEVIEVSLFHTVLLETGNWTDPGHPTGRKVTFTNSYAIEGHYFNFSTSGQWLWDELEVLIPPAESPNAVADAILNMVNAETQANQQLAEQEWKKLAAPAQGDHAVSAAPVVMVQPSGGGITARVRYITRANERFDLRARLYHRAVELLHGGRTAPASAQVPA